ncbi:hypothetical protein QBC37DRAFT_403945 [Rhypophila decipiens]|uniref:Uncharacterized protein n=1 Tax=Rhypophila decipiens TaxID=261697 RepID=A0AAN6Y0P3_9PEZI|nr:hypothetical protein QBC37DRAFT_403945 [Rhypophila decipiens]
MWEYIVQVQKITGTRPQWLFVACMVSKMEHRGYDIAVLGTSTREGLSVTSTTLAARLPLPQARPAHPRPARLKPVKPMTTKITESISKKLDEQNKLLLSTYSSPTGAKRRNSTLSATTQSAKTQLGSSSDSSNPRPLALLRSSSAKPKAASATRPRQPELLAPARLRVPCPQDPNILVPARLTLTTSGSPKAPADPDPAGLAPATTLAAAQAVKPGLDSLPAHLSFTYHTDSPSLLVIRECWPMGKTN